MNEFKTFHPIVNFTYFLFVIIFSCLFMHPVCLLISLTSSFVYLAVLKGKKTVISNLKFLLPLMLLMAIINPIFNHEGATILAYFPNSNPLTLESVIYGISSAVMLASIIYWFSCLNEVITSDKFIYLFGKTIPSLSLIISMTLRFVPRFISHFKAVVIAHKCIGCDISNGGIKQRLKNVLLILSQTVTWAFENSIETSLSMKSRGYGVKKRSTYSIYKFNLRDKVMLIIILFLGILIFTANIFEMMRFTYFPKMDSADISLKNIAVYIMYFILCLCPVIIEITEVRRWNFIK